MQRPELAPQRSAAVADSRPAGRSRPRRAAADADPLIGISSETAPPVLIGTSPATGPAQAAPAPAGHSAFLDAADVVRLTGYSTKRRQVEQLARMGIAFFVNGLGTPVVPRSAVEGQRQTPAAPADAAPAGWAPGVLKRPR